MMMKFDTRVTVMTTLGMIASLLALQSLEFGARIMTTAKPATRVLYVISVVV
jgi:hypothetical protein